MEYIEWKKSSSLEVCSKTGAILSITWNCDGEGFRDPLSLGSAKRRKFAIGYLFKEVFGSPAEAEWAAPASRGIIRASRPAVRFRRRTAAGGGERCVRNVTAGWRWRMASRVALKERGLGRWW